MMQVMLQYALQESGDCPIIGVPAWTLLCDLLHFFLQLLQRKPRMKVPLGGQKIYLHRNNKVN